MAYHFSSVYFRADMWFLEGDRIGQGRSRGPVYVLRSSKRAGAREGHTLGEAT